MNEIIYYQMKESYNKMCEKENTAAITAINLLEAQQILLSYFEDIEDMDYSRIIRDLIVYCNTTNYRLIMGEAITIEEERQEQERIAAS